MNAPAKDDAVLLTPQELCARWKNKISVGTLRNWRAKSKGPRPTKIGGSIFYMLNEVENYEAEQTKTRQSEIVT